MHWLVTTKGDVDAERLDDLLRPAGAAREAEPPVPLGPDEKAWEVQGPPDLDRRLASTPSIEAVYPSSRMTPY